MWANDCLDFREMLCRERPKNGNSEAISYISVILKQLYDLGKLIVKAVIRTTNSSMLKTMS